MKTAQPKIIVGIGGSPGALNAYKALLDATPQAHENVSNRGF